MSQFVAGDVFHLFTEIRFLSENHLPYASVSRFAGKWTTAGFLKLVRPVLSWDLNDAFFEA